MVVLPLAAWQVLVDWDWTAPIVITGTPGRPIEVLSTEAWTVDLDGLSEVVTDAHSVPELMRPERLTTQGGATVSAVVVLTGPVSSVGAMILHLAGDNPSWGLHPDPRRAATPGPSGRHRHHSQDSAKPQHPASPEPG